MIKRTFAAVSILGILSACGQDANEGLEANAASIVGGNLESGHPAVGRLMFAELDRNGVKRADVEYTCTATLVAPKVVLTAARCIWHDIGPRYIDHRVEFSTKGAVDGASKTYSANATNVRIVPNYVYYKDVRYDIGVVELDREVPIQPAKVARSIDGDIRGKDVTLVGFGFGEPNGDEKGELGVKRSVTTRVASLYPSSLEIGDGTGRGAWHGDEGSPVFFRMPGGEQVIVGVHSTLIQGPFGGSNLATRTDAHVDFLAPYIMEALVDVSVDDETPPPPNDDDETPSPPNDDDETPPPPPPNDDDETPPNDDDIPQRL